MLAMDLSGRRAVMTGASLGIGAATVTVLADHGAWAVLVTSVPMSPMNRSRNET